MLMSSFGQLVRIKYITVLAFRLACRRSVARRPTKSPGKNLARAFEQRQPKLKATRVRSIDWNRHGIHVYDKITEWFDVISKVLQEATVSAPMENVMQSGKPSESTPWRAPVARIY